MQKLLWLLPVVFIVGCSNTALPASDAAAQDVGVQAQGTKAKPAPLPTTSGRSFYLDCNGNDRASGTSAGTAFRTLNKVSGLSLLAGDKVLLKRGCTFTGSLVAKSSGTAAAPIVYTTYGEGAAPTIVLNIDSEAVLVGGNHLVFDGLNLTSTRPAPAGTGKCASTPVAWRVGFAVTGQYNTVQNSSASGFMAGVHLMPGANNNRVLSNTLTNNNVMKKNTAGVYDDDSGAWGVLVNSNGNEVANNTFSGNWACSEDYGVDGASVELYEASGNNVHHNLSTEDITFTELGGTPTSQSENNTFSYNRYAPVKVGGAMIVLRGTKSHWGGNPGTVFHHNVGYMVDLGIICSDGCAPSILKAHDNILWQRDAASGIAPAANMTPMWADAPFTEYNNVFWKTTGRPYVSIDGGSLSATDRIADPLFVNASALNFTSQLPPVVLASASRR